MTTEKPKIKSPSDTMRERMIGLPGSVRTIAERALSAFDAVSAKRKLLNPAAADFKEAMRNGLASPGLAPALARAIHQVGAARRQLESDRAALRSKAIQHDSPRSAQMAAEMRTYLRSLKPGEATPLLVGPKADPLAQRAVLEAPAALSGIDGEMRSRTEAALLVKNHGAEVTALDEQDAALEYAQAAVDLAKNETQRAFDGNPHEFAGFMAGLAPSAEQLAEERVAAKAASDKAREEFVDKRLAEIEAAAGIVPPGGR